MDRKQRQQGFKVYTAAEAAKQADIIMILINDELQADMYKKDIEPNLEARATCLCSLMASTSTSDASSHQRMSM